MSDTAAFVILSFSFLLPLLSVLSIFQILSAPLGFQRISEFLGADSGQIPLPAVEFVEYTVMNKIWLSLLPEIFAQLKARDKYILGHFYGVFGYEKEPPDRLALELELTIDGVYKAKENALRALKALYYGSPLHIWRKAYMDMDTKKAAREAG